jgi:hypothetical protein
VHTLVDHQATQTAILERLAALLVDHDPVHPFILWCSGLGFGSGEATRLLTWDAPLSDPGQGTLDLGFLKALLMKGPTGCWSWMRPSPSPGPGPLAGRFGPTTQDRWSARTKLGGDSPIADQSRLPGRQRPNHHGLRP